METLLAKNGKKLIKIDRPRHFRAPEGCTLSLEIFEDYPSTAWDSENCLDEDEAIFYKAYWILNADADGGLYWRHKNGAEYAPATRF